MVLRSGAKQGPARAWDLAGAAAGFGAVLVLAVFVVVAGNRAGYSHIEDPISALGARGAPGATWFTVVNVVGAVLIVVFALGMHRRLPVGLSTFLLLSAVALGAVLLGMLRCSGACDPGTVDGHGIAARFTALMIIAFLVSAAVGVSRGPKGWFRSVTILGAITNIAFGGALLVVVEGNAGRAGLFERLFWGSAYLWVLVASVAIVLATRRRVTVDPFDPGLVQSKILRSRSEWAHAAYACCSIRDGAEAKRWLRKVIDAKDLVRPGDDVSSPGSVTLAFTCAGLRVLGVEYPGTPDDPFAQGMRARAHLLGDVDDSDPINWKPPWSSDELHLLAWVEADRTAERDALLQRLSLRGHKAFGWLGLELASAPSSRGHPIEHLGFRDGISQPWLCLQGGKHDARRKPGGTRDAFGEWRPLAIGEFVLGERDESGDISRVPEPSAVFRHGSFVVVRKLAQDLAGFQRVVERESQRLDGADFAELLMGRRRDGRPLGSSAPASDNLNDITYGDDGDGSRCPLGAHIRRANPRDALGFDTLLSVRHRIIRRGKPYHADANAPAGWGKGLMFIAVNARIADQFEFIQRFWLNDGDRQRLGAARDVVAGTSSSDSPVVTQLERGPVVTAPIPVLVRTMGGAYLFAPSMAGLRALADL